MMFGVGVAEQLEEAGLLVREHHDPAYAKSGIVMDQPTHWMVRCEWDGVTPLDGSVSNHGAIRRNRMYAPNSIDNEIKAWVRVLQTPKHPDFCRRYEKVYTKQGSASRWAKMLQNFGKPWGITGTLVPVKFVEVG